MHALGKAWGVLNCPGSAVTVSVKWNELCHLTEPLLLHLWLEQLDTRHTHARRDERAQLRSFSLPSFSVLNPFFLPPSSHSTPQVISVLPTSPVISL